MARYIFAQLSILFCSHAVILVDYKFGLNYTQEIVDHSEFGNTGQNGNTVSSNRGAYFTGETSFIKLPANTIETTPMDIGSRFMIVMWCFPMAGSSSYNISTRVSILNDQYFMTNILLW